MVDKIHSLYYCTKMDDLWFHIAPLLIVRSNRNINDRDSSYSLCMSVSYSYPTQRIRKTRIHKINTLKKLRYDSGNYL